MIAEKPSWINHEGMQIFSIDIQPGGLRFATGGGDHKVRIWNMICVRGEFEGDQSTQRVLATLHDHSGSVNCVRWAKHGRYIASGSDDQVILIRERKPGSGTIEFGKGEQPDVENWKVTMTLKGHTADVVDLNWSPDDSTLASASLDNTVHIWSMSNNMCTAVLRGHSSLVKGVTWDPLGCFVASQSDDKTVIFWRTGDWSLAHRTDGHWAKSLGSTFFRRLGWSPCGRFITTTHGFQKPRHSAPVLERGDWAATFDFLGHNAPIIVVKFNHSMFRRNFSNGQEEKASSVGWTKGDSKTSGKESNPYNVIAIGSQDHTITVWTTANHRPLFVAKHFFTQSVVDLSWSTDGYALFACSLDGTVATFHFEVKELGHRLSETELDGLRRNSCGDGRGRESNLAESPEQLLLEAASAKQSSSRKVLANGQNQTSVIPSGDVTITNESLSVQKVSHPQIEHVRKNEVSGDGSNRVDPSVQISSPAKQRECRIANGRKRITPVAVGMPNHQEDVSGWASAQEPDLLHGASNPAKDDTRMVLAEGGLKECSVRRNGNLKENNQAGNSNYPGIQERFGVTARATLPENLIIEKVPSSSTTDGRVSVDISKGMKVSGSQNASCSALSITVYDKKGGEDSMPVRLEARRVERTTNDVVGVGNALMTNETEITCTCGAQTLWSDRMSKVTVLAGNANFWAVGCEDGGLQVYTKCGRRAMPTIMMGSAAVFIDCDECWKLLVVTRSGSIYVWDLFNVTCLLHESLAPLITSQPDLSAKDSGTIKVISAKFSKSGLPLLVLATRHAFLFDTSLKCWLRIADDCFPASNFASSWNYGTKQGGELAALQVDVGKFLARKPTWNRVADDGMQTRAHLETQLASSLALKSSNEYRQCLQSYVRFLAREGDVSRLREICESFLGPPTGMIESMSDPKNPAWDPCVLGTRKHKLLREDVLPAMATNRAVQRLLNEFMDLLSEYDNNGSYLDQGQSIRDHVDSAKPATEQLDPAPSIGS